MTTRTDMLKQLRSGRQEALDRLLPEVYEELRAIAHRRLTRRPGGGTLVTTALVHEVDLKLVNQSGAEWRYRDRLTVIEPRLARLVECRFYGGLSHEEIAEVLGVTVGTVERDWAKARMLLRRALDA